MGRLQLGAELLLEVSALEAELSWSFSSRHFHAKEATVVLI